MHERIKGHLKVLKLKFLHLIEKGIVKWCNIFSTCYVFQGDYIFLPVYGTLT